MFQTIYKLFLQKKILQRVTVLILFLLIKDNAFAYCYATQWSSYGPVYSSLGVADGTTMQACQALACQIYPHIPECGYVAPQPVCTSQVEYQTLSCPVHSSGAINQSRTYQCTNQAWGPWTTTSNNCSPDPPTCHVLSETQTLACQSGYQGLITQNRTSTCSDPYGSPTWSAWSTTSDTCTMTMTNINNPTSPVSPISPTNPNSVISKSIATVEPVMVQDLTATAPTQSAIAESSGSTQKSESPSGTASSSTSSSTGNSAPSKTEAKIDIATPKGKEIVPGFGIVMSMQMLNAGYNMQQEQMQEYINLIQDQEYDREQNFLLEFISSNDTGDNLNRIANYRWKRLLGDNQIQSSGLGD